MGLDMYLYRRDKSANDKFNALKLERIGCKDNARKEQIDNEFDDIWGQTREVGYFRKHNALRRYIVDCIYCGVENPCEYSISCELTEQDIKGIIDTIMEVLRDNSLAGLIYPTGEGFFFGSYEYDNYYYDNLKEEVSILQDVLDHTDFEKDVIIYGEWW